MKSNRYEGREHEGKRVTLDDGRKGVVTHGGYGMLSVDLDGGGWVSGLIRGFRNIRDEAGQILRGAAR